MDKKLCSQCETGANAYSEDKKAPTCPYINCYNVKEKQCAYYKELKTEKIVEE